MSGATSNAVTSAVTERVDVAVIGGGVIGLSIALELRRRGRGVVVIERDQPGAATSTVAAGMLAPTLRGGEDGLGSDRVPDRQPGAVPGVCRGDRGAERDGVWVSHGGDAVGGAESG